MALAPAPRAREFTHLRGVRRLGQSAIRRQKQWRGGKPLFAASTSGRALKGSQTGRLAPSRRRLLMAAMAASARGLSTSHKKPQKVVIAGGGVIGCATAYFLAKEHGICVLQIPCDYCRTSTSFLHLVGTGSGCVVHPRMKMLHRRIFC